MFFDFDDFDVRDKYELISEKEQQLNWLLSQLNDEQKSAFHDVSIRAFLFHDSALDGDTVNSDEIMMPYLGVEHLSATRARVLKMLKNLRNALENFILQAEKRRISDSLYASEIISYEDIIKLHEQLYTDTVRKKAWKIRRVMPVHSNYFHSFVEPRLIENQLRLLCKYTEQSDFRAQHPINQAVFFHYQFMRIFPFAEGSGKIGRLLMNNFLLQGGYRFVVIHASERQRYYEALSEGKDALRNVLLENMEISLDSKVKYLERLRQNNNERKATYKKQESGLDHVPSIEARL